MLDCENLGLHHMPVIDDIMQRHITKAYMSGNRISLLESNYFDKWYSLKFVDFSQNPDFHCDDITKIPEHVKVQLECEIESSGK